MPCGVLLLSLLLLFLSECAAGRATRARGHLVLLPLPLRAMRTAGHAGSSFSSWGHRRAHSVADETSTRSMQSETLCGRPSPSPPSSSLPVAVDLHGRALPASSLPPSVPVVLPIVFIFHGAYLVRHQLTLLCGACGTMAICFGERFLDEHAISSKRGEKGAMATICRGDGGIRWAHLSFYVTREP